MEQDMILVKDFCQYYQAEVSFVQSLQESGLVEVIVKNENDYITFEEMPRLEKFVRLHYDLDINVEGLETIDHLLRKIESLQHQLMGLNRLHKDDA